ncbi:hypothetical protein EF847_13075 [Actinobacteria bacterium YIM 96077]|uniref:Uncharacterized protein n=1 Tax=Phytoactinopolyspora halophila TaxID=1981511 RepID=A0A329QJI0_9ACTN|nr:hypothetical protein EF847_13075 [Actinobacteria bacterium YIM 96077]RAW12460.1 hypothetical protein DPM12_14970 [Phytoactinopolyspora halophila]
MGSLEETSSPAETFAADGDDVPRSTPRTGVEGGVSIASTRDHTHETRPIGPGAAGTPAGIVAG